MIDVYYVVSEVDSINRRTDVAKFFTYTDALVHSEAVRERANMGRVFIETRQEAKEDQHPAHK
jgi:hypothetical protein